VPDTNLTKRSCDAAAPESATYILWDSALPGFGLRVSAAGRKSFVLKYRDANTRRQHWHTIGSYGIDTTAEQARKSAELLKANIKHGAANPAVARREHFAAATVSELADAYLAEQPNMKGTAKKESSWKQDRSNIEAHIKPLLGRNSIRSLNQKDIRKFHADVAAGKTARDVTPERDSANYRPRARRIVQGGPGTANRCLAVLSAMLGWAVSRGALKANPAAGVRPQKTRTVRRDLRGHEIETLATALATWQSNAELLATEKEREAARLARRKWTRAIQLLLLTGARKNEILRLRWAEFDRETHCLMLGDSKTGAKTIPLGDAAIAILEACTDDADGSTWVFPSTKTDGPLVGLQKVWEAVCEAGGLEGVTIHSLRHTFASKAANEGPSLYLASKLLGHADVKTTQGYSHVDMERARGVATETAGALARHFSVIKGGKAA